MNQPAPLDYQKGRAPRHPVVLGLRLSSIGILIGIICTMSYLRGIHWPTDLLAKYGLAAGLLGLGLLVCFRLVARSRLDLSLAALAFLAILLGVYYGCFAPRYIIRCEPGLRNTATDVQKAGPTVPRATR